MSAYTIFAIMLAFQTPANGQGMPVGITAVNIDGIIINVAPMADDATTVQWKVLAAQEGINSQEALSAEALKRLRRDKKLKFDLQRVEVAGVGSVDDSEDSAPDMFDKQVKLSHLKEVLPSRRTFVDKAKSLFATSEDLGEALSDTRGIPTKRGQEAISALKKTTINELYAHSWGTEVVYLGILNGNIIPPKKLFILGVPEANREKWLLLAKYTGIEVHVVGFEYDKAKVAGNLAVRLTSGLPKDYASLDNLWRGHCAQKGAICADPAKFMPTKFDYNVGVHPPDAPKDEFFRVHLSKLDHDRMLYYRYLYNRKLFTKTAAEMDAPQAALVKIEEGRILDSAMNTARKLIAEAREQGEIANRERAERGLPGEDRRLWNNVNADEFSKRMQALKKSEPDAQVAVASPLTPKPIENEAAFFSLLPNLRRLAETACQSPEKISTVGLLPPLKLFFSAADDEGVRFASAGLGACEIAVFKKLVATVRAGESRVINDQWIRDIASASHTPAAPVESQRSSNTASDGPTPPRGRICYYNDLGHQICEEK